MEKNFLGCFTKNNCKRQKTKQYVKWQGYDNSFDSCIHIVPEPYSNSKIKIKVKLNFSNYATKSDLKNAAGVDTSKFPK